MAVLRAGASVVGHTAGLEPGLQQARRRRRPALWLALQQQAHKVLGSGAHSLEVVLWEAEVQAADVQTRLLQAFIQEGRGAAQHNIGHHPWKQPVGVNQSFSSGYDIFTEP